MLDLLIINPSAAHGITGDHPIYGDLGNDLIAVEPPLFCRLIAGYIRDHGYSVKIIDAEAHQDSPKSVAQLVANEDPRLIGIAVYGHQPSASTQQMVGAGECARAIKELTERPIIMVGGHPSALPARTLTEEAVDYVGAGEGPLTILGLLRGDEIAIVPGLVWLDGSVVRSNAPAKLIEDLSELHGDAWDLLPMKKYRAHNWQCLDGSPRQPYASIYTSLGCPYKCSFCCINAPFDSNRYRMRRPIDVVQEIRRLRDERGIFTFKITDEMFVLRPSHYLKICEMLAEYNRADNLNIWAYARVDTVQPENLAVLRRAGIKWLALGIESGSAHVRDGANKKMRTEDIVGTVRTIQDHGINVIGNFIFGLRDDDFASMCATLNLAVECLPDFANFYSCMAYPGSGLYTQAIKEGWALPETWRGYSQHNDDCRPLDTEHETGKSVLEFRDMAFNIFFRHPKYLSHIERKFGAAARDHIIGMTRYKLKRKLLEAA